MDLVSKLQSEAPVWQFKQNEREEPINVNESVRRLCSDSCYEKVAEPDWQ